METKKKEKVKNLPKIKEVQSLKVGDVLSFWTCIKERGFSRGK